MHSDLIEYETLRLRIEARCEAFLRADLHQGRNEDPHGFEIDPATETITVTTGGTCCGEYEEYHYSYPAAFFDLPDAELPAAIRALRDAEAKARREADAAQAKRLHEAEQARDRAEYERLRVKFGPNEGVGP